MILEKVFAPVMGAWWLYRHWWNLWGAWSVAVASGTMHPPCNKEKWK